VEPQNGQVLRIWPSPQGRNAVCRPTSSALSSRPGGSQACNAVRTMPRTLTVSGDGVCRQPDGLAGVVSAEAPVLRELVHQDQATAAQIPEP
jgi:hypothetical protein